MILRLDAAHVGDRESSASGVEIEVVFEDAHLLAVNKPPHLSV